MRLKDWQPLPLAEWPQTAIPLINVMLLFAGFLLLAPMLLTPAGIPLQLPRAITAEAVGGAGITITITDQQLVYVNGHLTAMEELPRQMEAIVAANRSTTVLIRSDQRVPVALLARLWDLCRQLGVARVAMATTKPAD